MVTFESWSKVSLGNVRLIPADEPCKTLEEVISRVKGLNLTIYGPVVLNVYNDKGFFKPKALLSAAKKNKRMRINTLFGVMVARDTVDGNFYLHFQKEYSNRVISFEYTDKILRVEYKDPEVFPDMETALASAKSRGFNFYDTIIVENLWRSTPLQLNAVALLTKSIKDKIIPSDPENALIVRDDQFVTKPSFNLYVPRHFKVESYETALIHRPNLY